MTINISRRGKQSILHIFLFILVILNIFPIFWMISSAFKLPNELFTRDIYLIPHVPTLDNFRTVIEEYDLLNWFYNSIVTTLGIAVTQIIVSMLAAFALTYYKTRFNAFIFYMLIATMVIPFQVTMIPNYILTSRMGILNTPAAVIIPNIANASTFFFIRQHVSGIPKAFFEAAEVEGANSFWIFRKVVFRICQGAILSMFILCLIDGWNQYFWPLLVLSSSEHQTLTIGLQQFLDHETGNRWGPFMATATLASLPMMIIYGFIQKNIIDAFVGSGIKG